MAKPETRLCIHCGQKFAKDKSRCPSCKQWNIERAYNAKDDGTMLLSEADDKTVTLIQTGPWDPCFGRRILENGDEQFGIPQSSVTLVGGKAGAGKSTLALQFCESICNQSNGETLIVSVEEAAAQVKERGKRLKLKHMNRIRLVRGDVELSDILMRRKPTAIIVDSLPKLCPDMAAAVEFCKRLKAHIEELCIPAIVIDHINKEEEFAGLEALQHEVDATLIFTVYPDEVRELRSMKNRNAPSGVRVFFDMTDSGLVERDPNADNETDDDNEE
jgi:DNA repair protein RadA/Sms